MNILVGHLLGDILLQNRWLASVKRKSWLGLFLHCLLVTGGFYLFNRWPLVPILSVFTTHFIIDGLGIGKNYPKWVRMGNPDKPDESPALWLRLLSDQSMHLISYCMINTFLIN